MEFGGGELSDLISNTIGLEYLNVPLPIVSFS